MDKVQFQLESTLPELKDLHEKGLFTKNEINEITRRRTAFESALIRRIQRKEDFFRYAQYEINLERLRRVRWRKLRYHINPPPPSASTYSIQRRTLYILKRATSKFPQDLSVWLTYIQYASREGMRKVVGQGIVKAMQFHPTSSTLYLLQAYYHLHPASPFPDSILPSSSKSPLSLEEQDPDDVPIFAIEGISPARTALLMGLRLVPASPEIWTEYVKIELGWVEALRRRWKVLGINDINSKGKQVEESEFEGDIDALRGGEGAFGEEGEEARKQILSGQLVIHALTSALKAIKPEAVIEGKKDGGMWYRQTLLDLFRGYPSPLRAKCLGVVYNELEEIATSVSEAASQARLLSVSRGLFEKPYAEGEEPVKEGEYVLSGVELVEEFGKIGKNIRKSAKGAQSQQWIEVAGEWLIGRIEKHGDYPELRDYLLSLAGSLTKSSLHPPASYLIAHLHLLSSLSSPELLPTARAHSAQYPANATIQSVRLSSELSSASADKNDETRKMCETVARSVILSEDKEGVLAIWKTWASWENDVSSPEQLEKRWEYILKLSLKIGSTVVGLHDQLLPAYILSLYENTSQGLDVISKSVLGRYRPSPVIFAQVFEALKSNERSPSPQEMQGFFQSWKALTRSPTDLFEVSAAHLTYLVETGKGAEGHKLYQTARREVGEGLEGQLESVWVGILEKAKEEEEGSSGSGSESESGDEDEEMSEA
ncbi:hypothetical protein B9479_006599 [Cryptococcus floricola]|uniref:U3 small nucleolar RNA-associated protein 6 N-terminal domain-containing protein n=1 Tax=Cryptococcus floricola TaxID=2591691 RepID=A0A5D3AMT0_9TREE|nr:hypothetical protein B9479_006599 [Cryptococcus floricola]